MAENYKPKIKMAHVSKDSYALPDRGGAKIVFTEAHQIEISWGLRAQLFKIEDACKILLYSDDAGKEFDRISSERNKLEKENAEKVAKLEIWDKENQNLANELKEVYKMYEECKRYAAEKAEQLEKSRVFRKLDQDRLEKEKELKEKLANVMAEVTGDKEALISKSAKLEKAEAEVSRLSYLIQWNENFGIKLQDPNAVYYSTSKGLHVLPTGEAGKQLPCKTVEESLIDAVSKLQKEMEAVKKRLPSVFKRKK